MTILDSIDKLTDLGFHVFPLRPGEKLPREAGYPDTATCDRAALRRQWMCPVLEVVQPYNIGISTTRFGLLAEPLVAIDVDVKEAKGGAESFAALEAAGFTFPPTFSQTTPTGGRHLVYRTPFPLRQIVSTEANPGPLGRGIDTRSRGGFIVGAGSTVPAGQYEADWREVADAPEWLIEKLGRPIERELPGPSSVSAAIDQAAAIERAVHYLVYVAPPSVKGRGGDATAVAVANALFDEGVADPADVLRLMLEHWNPRCSPPGWAPEKLRVKVRNAQRYRKRAVGSDAPEVMFGQAEEPTTDGDVTRPPSGKPHIVVSHRQFDDELADTWKAVKRANVARPTLFQRRGDLVRLRLAEDGPTIERASSDWLMTHLAAIAHWYKPTPKGSRIPTRPPRDVCVSLVQHPAGDLPELESAGTEPVFTQSGRLVTVAGYDLEARYYLHGDGGASLAGIPDDPTDQEIAAARGAILDDLLEGFPFVGAADRAHAVAALVLPLARRLIVGPTPLHVIEAPTIGTGKSLLAKVLTLVATGRVAPALPFPTTEEEWSKTLTTELLKGAPAVLLDNAPERTKLASPAFAATLTAEQTASRLLGKNEAPSLPNHALWLMTGNNPRVTGEWVRRSIRIRIDRNQERPWQTAEGAYRHRDLLGWARACRRDLLRAPAILVRAWLARGRPSAGVAPLGSFERWSDVIGGILKVAGVPGFLENQAAMYEANEPETNEWIDFTSAWWEEHGEEPVRPAQLAYLCVSYNLLAEVLGPGSDRSRESRMGRTLDSMRDTIRGNFQIKSARRPPGSPGGKGTFWRLAPIGPAPIRSPQEVPRKSPGSPFGSSSGFDSVDGDSGDSGDSSSSMYGNSESIP